MATPQQTSFFGPPKALRSRKRVRQVSREALEDLVASGRLQAREGEFLEALRAYTLAHWQEPTAAELTDWAHRHGRITRNDPNRFRPRATALNRRGTIVFLPRRRCRITGRQAHPMQIAERQ